MRSMEEVRKSGPALDRRQQRRPEPQPHDRQYLVVSADDHLVEPPTVFVDRVPAGMRDEVPRVVGDAWLVDGETRPFTGGDSVVGWEATSVMDYQLPMRYEEMRPGSYNAAERLRDMDIDGVYASLAFPSMVWGFCGQRIWGLEDPDVAQACVRAYNDWIAEEWAGADPERLIPNQIVYLRDPAVAAAEVRRNAERGFRSVTLSENPEWLGLPSVHTRHWDQLLDACQETDTVINLHLGSSSTRPTTSSDAPVWVSHLLWPAHVMGAAAEWAYSQVCLRFPRLRLVFSEGGIGWVPLLLERMERAYRSRSQTIDWPGDDVTPGEVLQRNFWYCAIEEPCSFEQAHHIGTDRIMLESDYPHADTSWPHTQAAVHEQVTVLSSPSDVEKVTHANASALFQQPLDHAGDWMRSAEPAAPGTR